MSSFAILNDEKKIQKQNEKAKQKREADAIAAEERRLDRVEAVDEVKGRCWADVSDDEQEPPPAVVEAEPEESEDESDADGDDCCSPMSADKSPTAPEAKAPAKKASEPRSLTKKELAAQKKAELDDLDALLGEFGVATVDDSRPVEPKTKKKKKDKAEDAEKPAPAAAVEAAPALDDATKAAALEALKKKGAGGGKKKGADAKAAAAAEAKKRIANAPKQKKDKLLFDR